jgi:hypothetical protein
MTETRARRAREREQEALEELGVGRVDGEIVPCAARPRPVYETQHIEQVDEDILREVSTSLHTSHRVDIWHHYHRAKHWRNLDWGIVVVSLFAIWGCGLLLALVGTAVYRWMAG